MEKVSVIVPVYNVEKYIDKCMTSLVSQTYSNIEIILINDGSTDDSGIVCKKWEEENENIIVLEQDNQGVSSARNAGLKHASGEYIMFVDPDDWCELDFVEKMVNAISESDIAYCSFFIDTDQKCQKMNIPVESGLYPVSNIYEPLFFGSLNKKNTIMPASLCTGIFKRRIIVENHILFDSYIRFAEDWLFYAEYFRYIKSITIVNDALYHYFQRENSAMHVFKPASLLGIQKSVYILDKFLTLARQTSINNALYEPWMARRYMGLVLNQVKNVWNKQSPLSISEKKGFIKMVLRETDICSIIRQFRKTNFTKLDQILLGAIKKKRVLILSFYGIAYNVIRDLKNMITK